MSRDRDSEGYETFEDESEEEAPVVEVVEEVPVADGPVFDRGKDGRIYDTTK